MTRNSVNQLKAIKMRLRAIQYLRLLKKSYTYEKLSRELELPIPVLNRYVKGHVLPRDDRARKIIEFAEKVLNLEKELLRRIKFDREGFFDNTKIIYDINLMKIIVEKMLSTLNKWNISKVFTAAADGIPLATLVASELGVDMIYAKREKEVGIKAFLEERCVLGSSGITVSLYVPRGSIKPRDRVLIVDDIIRTGETQKALLNLVKKARAEVAGIFVLIAIGDYWKKHIPANIPVKIFLNIK
ncbi:MAG: phosphoribosyltransferase family protein [Candidatus Njordarchaeum guaymaensis]